MTHFISHCLCPNPLSPRLPSLRPLISRMVPHPHGILYVVLTVGEQAGWPFGLVLVTQQNVALWGGKAGQPASHS